MGLFGTAKKASAEVALKCTYCGGTDFFGGPEGGMSQSVLCANATCRHWFYYTPGISLDDLQRIEPTPDEAAQREAARLAEADARRLELMQFGRQLYFDDKPLIECVSDLRLRRFTSITESDHFRTLGWLEAAARDRRTGNDNNLDSGNRNQNGKPPIESTSTGTPIVSGGNGWAI